MNVASAAPPDVVKELTPTDGQRRTFEYGVDGPLPEDRTNNPHELTLCGWMFSLAGTPVLGTASIQGMPDVVFTTNQHRPDVVEYFLARGQTVTEPCGFHVRLPFPEHGESRVTLTVTFSDGFSTSEPKVCHIERTRALTWPPAPARLTLISHLFNEEYLLPQWLRHHVPLFDHGILINRGSTDRSVAICRELAPHWEVRDARCLEFDAEEVDQEVMAIEREVNDWKFVLNTTEFLHVHSKDSFLSALQSYGRRAYGIQSLYLTDPAHAGYPEYDTGRPLAAQRHHGAPSPLQDGCRYMHNHEDGRYTVGRHTTRHAADIFPKEGAVILKLVFTPWNETFKRRRLQIHPTFSKKSLELRQGIHHVATLEELEALYASQASLAADLRDLHEVAWVFHQASRTELASRGDKMRRE